MYAPETDGRAQEAAHRPQGRADLRQTQGRCVGGLEAFTDGIADADGLTSPTYSYQWLADDVEIAGATVKTYTLVDADEGTTIKVRVSFDDDDNAETLTSAATAVVAAKPNRPATGAPTITGTAQVGETLEALTNGIADADGLASPTYSYQWLADDMEIAGATTSTYTLVAGDQGTTITVRVSFNDDANNEESLTSAATASVAAASVPADMQEALAFAERGYIFDLGENTDGSTNRVSLGTVSATDPEGAALTYSIGGGNASGLFEIDAASGEMFYTGAGEDFEAGAGPFEFTVRASGGDLVTQTIVVVTVTDVQETPEFAQQGYSFDLAENTDGSATRVSLGTVAATDPEGAALSYSIEGGNTAGLFEIDAASGELFYTGAGEDFEAGTGPFELTVRASDGDLSTDTAVTVSVTDVQEAPKSVSEPDGEDFPPLKSTDGRVVVGDSVTGNIPQFDRDWFAVKLGAGGEYRFDLKGSPTGNGTLDNPHLTGIYNKKGRFLPGTSNGDGGTGKNSRKTFTADRDGTHYVGVRGFAGSEGTYTLSVTELNPPPQIEEPPITIEVADAEATGTILNADELVSEESNKDLPANINTKGVVAVGGSATGKVRAEDDVDWFRVTVKAGQTYKIDLEGHITGQGDLYDPLLLGIYDIDGNRLPLY